MKCVRCGTEVEIGSPCSGCGITPQGTINTWLLGLVACSLPPGIVVSIGALPDLRADLLIADEREHPGVRAAVVIDTIRNGMCVSSRVVLVADGEPEDWDAVAAVLRKQYNDNHAASAAKEER